MVNTLAFSITKKKKSKSKIKIIDKVSKQK